MSDTKYDNPEIITKNIDGEIYVIITNNIFNAFEYFCPICKQLRLSLDKDLIVCGNCGNPIIDCVRGKIGELNKEKLKRDYA